MASQDPYFEVASECEASLISLSSQLASFQRLSHSAPTDQLAWSLSELKATLVSLENDLEELEESVRAVEEPGVARRLGIRDLEVKGRREFVQRVKSEIDTTRRALGPNASPSLASQKRLSGIRSNHSTSAYPLHPSDDDDEDPSDSPNEHYEMQHQSMLMEQQDQTLTDIGGTVEMLREQARLMGREVADQNGMLEELDHHVDRTATKLAKAQRRMQNFIRENQNSPSSWCVFILMIILTLLLVVILFF